MKKLITYLLASVTAISMIFATSCNDPKPNELPPVSGTPEITLAVKSKTQTSAVITATVKATHNIKYINYPKGKRPSGQIEWKNLEVTTPEGAFDIAIAELTTGVDYTFEAMAVNPDKSSANTTLDYRTESAPVAVTLSDVVGAHNMVSFKGKFDKAQCDGFFYAIVPKAKYKEKTFLQECKPEGEGQVINAVVTQSDQLHKNQNGIVTIPDTDYVIATVGAKFDEKGFWKSFVGDPLVTEVKTASVEIGKVDKELTFTVDNAKTTFGNAEAVIAHAAGDGIRGYYYGSVAKSTLGAKTIEAYVAEWLMIKTVGVFADIVNIERINDFDDAKSITVKYNDLNSNTDYILFALAYDDMGWLGKLTSKEIKTAEPVINPGEEGVTVDKASDITSCKMNLTWTAGYTKAYVLNIRKDDPLTKEQALHRLYQRFLNGETADWTSVMKDHTFQYLEPKTDYVTYIITVKNDGTFGAPTFLFWKTSEISFASPAKVAVTVTKIVLNTSTYQYATTIEIAYTDGAVSSEYIVVESSKADTRTAKELVLPMYEKGATFVTTNKTQIVYGFEETEIDYAMIFTPIDATGSRGEPVMFKVAKQLP